MTALESIVDWAESDLPEWQSDAVRRLLVQDALTDEDRFEILAMVKALHGLLPEGVTPPTPQPLKKGMVSGASKSKAEVVLKAVKDLKNVNRIPDGSALLFGHQGLTAIYGENGSGKSGYARVLKRACRARDTQERILPNVYSDAAEKTAKATFKLSINAGDDQLVEWEDGKPNAEVLTNITVFDSKCARVIVDEKNEATYLPYGAHVFEELVNLLNWIKKQIESEKPKLEPLQLPEISPSTKSGSLLASLTHSTNAKDIEGAAVWSDSDSSRLEKLTKQLAELEANDPIKQAAKVRSFKERVTNLTAYIEHRSTILSDEHLAELKEKIFDVTEAEKAVELASQTALNNEPLAGAGETAWQILYAAAKEYSTKNAYPDQEFPVVEEGSRCVFCMQPLGDDARQRLLRFKGFMEQTTKKKHEAAKKARDTAIESVKALIDQATHSNTIDEVKQRAEIVADATTAYLAALHDRLEYVDQLIAGGEAAAPPPLPNSPITTLNEITVSLEKEAEEFEKAVDPAERQKLKDEKAELTARKCLVECRVKVLAHLADIKTAHKCEQAHVSTDSAAITRKGKQVISEALTPQLKDAIQSELKLLGADHLPLSLKPSGSKGETLHQFELKGIKPDRKVTLTEVLSEGEQRVVALAGFFAEIGLGQHSCPIVLDDPVSSLDHRYRATIAARLVTESKLRQVLVFTHDIAFLLDLQESAEKLSEVFFAAQTLLQHGEAAGLSSDGLPWHAMPVKSRLEQLRNTLNAIKTLHTSDQSKYDKEAAYLYALLRESWEAAIEEILLNKTIVRHGSEVQTLRLKEVSVTTEQHSTIYANMSKCSTWMAGHDKSKKLDVHRPEPNEILADIDALSAFIKACKKASETLKKERETALEPSTPPIG